MKRYLLALICLNCLVSLVYAQEETRIEEKDTLSSLESEVGLIPESLDANVDSLLRTWHVQYFSKREDFCHDDDENVYFPDSVYIDRLSRLPSVIALPYNNIVRDCIDLYAERKRNLVRYMLGMADFYFPIIEQVLDEHGLPIELKYLAVVESALNPVALSRVGACGLWQFMLPTGKSYGLEINSLVDERRDPLKATEAACKYFKDMYAIYGDWNLVLASYNCGPGNVNKAIRRSGGKTDFWDIFPYLPKETRSYVPLFIAANYVMNYYCEHNICPMTTTLPPSTDTIIVDRDVHFDQIVAVCNVKAEEVKPFNSQYRTGLIPGAKTSCILRLPTHGISAFIAAGDSVYTYKSDELFTNRSEVAVSQSAKKSSATRSRSSKSSRSKSRTHTIRSGETLSTIAKRYGTTVSKLKRLNGIKGTSIRAGKKLKVR